MRGLIIILCIVLAADGSVLDIASPVLRLEANRRMGATRLKQESMQRDADELTEDDILVRPMRLFSSSNLNNKNIFQPKVAYDSADNYLWPNGIVPYEIDQSLYHDNRAARILEALSHFNSLTCLQFVQRSTGHNDYVRFMDGGYRRCFSYVGRIGGMQELSVGAGCETQLGVIVHEVLHALGFIHEQSRPDRDEHVTIVWDAVHPEKHRNFEKYPPEAVYPDLVRVPYDYSSIMHYEAKAFSVDGKQTTIITKDQSAQTRIGQRDGFSACDIEKLNRMYDCPHSPFALKCSQSSNATTTTVATNTSTQPVTPASSTSTQSTTPSTTTTGVTTTHEQLTCQDVYAGCEDIRYDTTACDKFPGIYRKLCDRTCNQCKGTPCEDSHIYTSICESYATSDTCASQFIVRAICPRTCQLCQTPTVTPTAAKQTLF